MATVGRSGARTAVPSGPGINPLHPLNGSGKPREVLASICEIRPETISCLAGGFSHFHAPCRCLLSSRHGCDARQHAVSMEAGALLAIHQLVHLDAFLSRDLQTHRNSCWKTIVDPHILDSHTTRSRFCSRPFVPECVSDMAATPEGTTVFEIIFREPFILFLYLSLEISCLSWNPGCLLRHTLPQAAATGTAGGSEGGI